MVKAQFDCAEYSDIAFTIPTRIDANGTYYLIEDMNNKQEECTNAITTVQNDNLVQREVLGWSRDEKGNVIDRHPVEVANCVTAGKRENTQNYVKEIELINGTDNGCASTLTTGHDSAKHITEPKGGHKQMGVKETTGKKIRIRKLTEKECFRLMGVEDADIDKIQTANISKTQQYKMAGNSIVVDVLYHIFKKMFVETKADGGVQLEMF